MNTPALFDAQLDERMAQDSRRRAVARHGKSRRRYPTPTATSRQTPNFTSRPTQPQLAETAPVPAQSGSQYGRKRQFRGLLIPAEAL